MTTATQDVRLSALPPATGRAGIGGVLASEFTKLRSVRSTYWTVAALLIVSVGLAAAINAGEASGFGSDSVSKARFDATQNALGAFFYLGQLAIAVLGAMTVTSEYSTGMIRTSLTAMPRRGVLFASKLIVFTVVSLVVSLVTAFVSFFVGQAVLAGSGVSASLFHSTTVAAAGDNNNLVGSITVSPGTVLTAIIGTALYVTAAAVIAFGIGAILRHTAGAVATTVGVLFVLPIIIQLLPSSWSDDLIRFIPTSSGMVLSATIATTDNSNLWSMWPQFGVTLVWAAVLIGVGAYLFRTRDA